MSFKTTDAIWDLKLPRQVRDVLLYLGTKSNRDDVAIVSVEQIVSKTGASRRQVFRALTRLKEAGYIEVTAGRGRGHLSTYRLTLKGATKDDTLLPPENGTFYRPEMAPFNVEKDTFSREPTLIGVTRDNEYKRQDENSIFHLQEKLSGRSSITPLLAEELKDYESRRPWACIKHCYKRAADAGATRFSYVRPILDDHEAKGCDGSEPKRGGQHGSNGRHSAPDYSGEAREVARLAKAKRERKASV